MIQTASLPLTRSSRLPAVPVEGETDGLEVACPAGASLVSGHISDRWWSLSRSYMDGMHVTLCVIGHKDRPV